MVIGTAFKAIRRFNRSGDSQRSGYNAFISYSHRDSHALAVSLERAMLRFARPWHQSPRLRLFRDESSQTANAALWDSIESELSSSEWLVLLASAGAAQSPSVSREVSWWLDNRSFERIIFAATDSDLAWDKNQADWAASAPVPDVLRKRCHPEPRCVDLRSARRPGARGRFSFSEYQLADLVGPLLDIKKRDLINDHEKQRRGIVRVAISVSVAMTVLATAALSASVVAIGQLHKANDEARVATARELAGLSGENLSGHLDLAQLFAVAAYQLDDDPLTQSGLLAAVTADPHLARYLPAGAPVSAMGTSEDGRFVVAGTRTGRLVEFAIGSGSVRSVQVSSRRVTSVAVSPGGQDVLGADGRNAYLWAARSKREVTRLASGRIGTVGISPAGNLAVYLHSGGKSSWVGVTNLATHLSSKARLPAFQDELGFPSSSVLTVYSAYGGSQKLSLPDLTEISHGGALGPPGDSPVAVGSSPNGNWTGFTTYGDVTVAPTDRSMPEYATDNLAPVNIASALAVSSDGKYAAVAEGGTIYVGKLAKYRDPVKTGPRGEALTANDVTTKVSFLGGDRRLISANGSAIALWDLDQTSRLGQQTGVSVPPESIESFPPIASYSPDGRMLVVEGAQEGMSLYRVAKTLEKIASLPKAQSYTTLPAIWKADQPEFLSQNSDGGLRFINAQGHKLSELPTTVTSGSPVAIKILPRDNRAVMVDFSGDVELIGLGFGVRRLIPFFAGDQAQWQTTAIAPDGSDVAEADLARGVWLISTSTGKRRMVGSGEANYVTFTRTRLVIQRSSGALQFWDLTGQHLLADLPGDQSYAGALAVSPDGSLAARLSNNGTVSVISVPSGAVLESFVLPSPKGTGAPDPWDATTLVFSPDGHSLLTAISGGPLLRWIVYPPDLARIACQTVGRSLTAAEWRRYVGLPMPSTLPCQRRSPQAR